MSLSLGSWAANANRMKFRTGAEDASEGHRRRRYGKLTAAPAIGASAPAAVLPH
jgi:hypothetical protein